MPNVRSLLLVAVLGAACSPTVAVLSGPKDLTGSRFAGDWFIEETLAHATYFAATWRFAEDGTLRLVEDYSMGGGLAYPSVSSNGDGPIVCTFGDRWNSVDDVTLSVAGQCSDDTARSIDLRFLADASGDADGISPERVGVDGDASMWNEPVWGWRFFRCQDDGSNCDPWEP